MLWIGLTGCIGCGKSTVAEYYKSLNYAVISADEIVKGLYKKNEICEEIKDKLDLDPGLENDKILNVLSKEVFKNKEKLQKLEKILHPKVREEVLELRKNLKTSNPISFYDVPLLFEKSMQEQFDYILTVGSDSDLQRERIKKRNTWSDSEIEDRINNQLSVDYKRVNSDFYISNNKDLKHLKIEAKKILDRLLLISGK